MTTAETASAPKALVPAYTLWAKSVPGVSRTLGEQVADMAKFSEWVKANRPRFRHPNYADQTVAYDQLGHADRDAIRHVFTFGTPEDRERLLTDKAPAAEEISPVATGDTVAVSLLERWEKEVGLPQLKAAIKRLESGALDTEKTTLYVKQLVSPFRVLGFPVHDHPIGNAIREVEATDWRFIPKSEAKIRLIRILAEALPDRKSDGGVNLLLKRVDKLTDRMDTKVKWLRDYEEAGPGERYDLIGVVRAPVWFAGWSATSDGRIGLSAARIKTTLLGAGGYISAERALLLGFTKTYIREKVRANERLASLSMQTLFSALETDPDVGGVIQNLKGRHLIPTTCGQRAMTRGGASYVPMLPEGVTFTSWAWGDGFRRESAVKLTTPAK